MKVVLINYSGTVGKTTVAAHLLAPRMGNARIFAIETINETAEGLGMDVEKIKGERFKDLFRQIMLLDDAIMDLMNKGWISPDDAYLKANDKTKFRPFLRTPPTDFTEA